MISCFFVIVIHVTNYFCRAYGEITQSEYLFALLLDTLARVSLHMPCKNNWSHGSQSQKSRKSSV